MKNILLTAALCLMASLQAAGQNMQDDLFKAFAQKVSSSFTSVSYQYGSTISGALLSGEGLLEIQGLCYRNETSGLEVLCDGVSLWTADTQSREMVIETAGESASPLADPVLLLMDIEESFTVSSTRKTGDGLHEYHLLPSISCGVKECVLFLSGSISEPLPVKGHILNNDGNVFEITFTSVSFSSELKPVSHFRPSNIGNDWVVTDLR
ncbi:MAG: outer membrane lipoprotein carrier protein LolA [Candidatus Cryptobacteroides sp.]